jgi:hypothetical protein
LPLRAPTISCVLLTDHLSAESGGWFSKVRKLVDEFVVLIDTTRATDETYAIADELGTAVRHVEGKGFVEAHLEEMVEACTAEWILRLDSDEQLSAGWLDGGWRNRLIGNYTHFTVPRRWLHPSGGYIDCEPWWPDPQMRLFRNDLSLLTFPRQIHEPTAVRGPGDYLPELPINHHVLRLSTRGQREEKVRHYTRLRPELPLGHYYLFEDSSPSRTRIEDSSNGATANRFVAAAISDSEVACAN